MSRPTKKRTIRQAQSAYVLAEFRVWLEGMLCVVLPRTMGLAGREKMVREFDENIVISRYLETIQEILGK